MCKRMSNMLERDPELKKEAIKQGLDLQDLKMIDSMTMQNTLKQKADYGLRLWQKRKDLVTGDLKISIMADLYISRLMVAEYANLEHNVLAEIMAILRCAKGTVYDLLKGNPFRYIRLGRGAYRISGDNLWNTLCICLQRRRSCFRGI